MVETMRRNKQHLKCVVSACGTVRAWASESERESIANSDATI